MTTVEIKADKVVLACKQALLQAEDDVVMAIKEVDQTDVGSIFWVSHMARCTRCHDNVNWLKSMIAAAEASEGVVTMSVEDVGRIKEGLK